MRDIKTTEIPNWNPVPLVRGLEDWESNKQDNFGQILFPPVAPLGSVTIPGLYILPFEFDEEAGLGPGGLQIFVRDMAGNDVYDISGDCEVEKITNRWYLKVPPISLPSDAIPRLSSIVFLRFAGLGTTTTTLTDRMLCSEPYQIRGLDSNPQDTVEKQGTVTLRWWSGSDFVVEGSRDEWLLPYSRMEHYFELGFDAQLSKPVYKKTQEGSERDGLFFAEKTVITKEYHFFFMAPEYVLDALRFVHLADYVEIQQGTTYLLVDNIDFNIRWESEGDVARVDCSFTTNTVLRKSGTIEY